MHSKRYLYVMIVYLVLAACAYAPTFSGPNPAPREVVLPDDLSKELTQVRIIWKTATEEGRRYFIRLDGSDPIAMQGCSVLSSDERYLVCAPNIGLKKLELVDLQTGERRVLVDREDAFPTALWLGYPSFTPDGQGVIFDIALPDNSDLAIVDIDSGEIDFMYAPERVDFEATISPDNNWILTYCEPTPPGAGFVLCILDRETNKRFHLVDEALNIGPGSRFTLDSQSVVYIAPMENEGLLYRIDIEDRAKHLLVSGLHPQETILGVSSEDVVFTCTYPENIACRWVCVVGLDGSDMRRLTYLGEHCIETNTP